MLIRSLSINLRRFYKSSMSNPMDKKAFSKTAFKLKDERVDFVKNEEDVLAYWQAINAFQQQLDKTKHLPHYTFYDGPPFATGTPHYGHICAGTIKDVITRYQSMNGYHVERRFGWDCHGLPVEYEIDKQLKIENRKDIIAMGIDKYNDKCRSIVMRYSELWKEVVGRLGRWIDFENDYKTMDTSFMESVWWVFKQIFEKDMVYRGCRIMPYSNKCITVLSNFEAGLNYKDINDPAVVMSFPLVEDPETSFVAWTTTPWTLPSNLALAVNPNFEYVKIKDLKTGNKYIIAKCRLGELYKSGKQFADVEADVKVEKKMDKKKKGKGNNKNKVQEAKEEAAEVEDEFEILESYKGKDLEGKDYIPLFDYYYADMKPRGCFKVLCGNYVTSDSGTGIVHTAPAFGEEDYKICRKYDIIIPDDPCISIDENGIFVDKIADFKGVYIKDADKDIIKTLKERNRIVKNSTIKHSYPMCWRSNTPLIYKAINTWFIKVTDIKENIITNNKKATWVPKAIQEKRFHNWLENAEDWCFSRNRFWGNPIPLWVSDDYEEIVCVGSIAELKKLAGLPDDYPLTDIHREFIDDITIPSKMGKGVLRRVDEVFDCWFESGSMPYASFGYPYKMNDYEFKQRFPADFIGEGLDQTRGWFYTLNVISTAIFNDTPYKNLIVNGIVCNEKGEKLSKSQKNFTDPMKIVNKLGADVVRLYLMNSPLVKAESLNFKEEGLTAVVKDIFIPWYNLCRLLLQEINRYEGLVNENFVYNESMFKENGFEFTNLTDKWILAKTQNIINFVHQEFANYRLYTVLDKKIKYLDHLANWYVKLNKARFKGENGPQDAYVSLNVFFYCFFSCITVMAPYVPFIVEFFYQNLRLVIKEDSPFQEASIHFLKIPQAVKSFEDENLVYVFEVFQKLMTSVRKSREIQKVNLKQVVGKIKVMPRKSELIESFKLLEDYIRFEGNILDVEFSDDFREYCSFSLMPNHKLLGSIYGSKYDVIRSVLMKLSPEKINEYLANKELNLDFVFDGVKETITFDSEALIEAPKIIAVAQNENEKIAGDIDFAYVIDFNMTDELRRKGLARELTSRVQKQRKEAKVQIDDRIYILFKFNDGQLNKTYEQEKDSIRKIVKKPVLKAEDCPHAAVISSKEYNIVGEKVTIEIALTTFVINEEEFKASIKEEGVANDLKLILLSFDPIEVEHKPCLTIKFKGNDYVLEKGKHYNIF